MPYTQVSSGMALFYIRLRMLVIPADWFNRSKKDVCYIRPIGHNFH